MKPASDLPARERILLTAHDLFYSHGIRATGIDRVIAESGVAKVTFYRHFPSKNDLIRAYLEYRHQRWLEWFKASIERHGSDVKALVPVFAEWFQNKEFRGCAFINTVGELATSLPEVGDIARRHKEDMTSVIAGLLPASRDRDEQASALAVAVDGAIVRAQYDSSESALRSLDRIISAMIPEAPII